MLLSFGFLVQNILLCMFAVSFKLVITGTRSKSSFNMSTVNAPSYGLSNSNVHTLCLPLIASPNVSLLTSLIDSVKPIGSTLARNPIVCINVL